MALTFPANPTNGQIYDQYVYDATAQSWRVYGSDTGITNVLATKANLYGGNTFTGNQIFNGYKTSPGNPVFSAYASSGNIAPNQIMPYNNAVINRGNGYNTATYRFTAPISGVYLFSSYDIGNNTGTTRIALYRNGVSTEDSLTHQLRGSNASNYTTMTSFWTIDATAGDYFSAYVYDTASYGTIEYCWFQGFLIG
jgi:hypothetical protein